MTIPSADTLNFVLVNPYMNVPEGFGRYQGLMEPMPPVGIAYLQAALLQAGVNASVLDAFAERLDFRRAAAAVLAKNPDIVGISCLTPAADYSMDLARAIKESDPRVRVVMGNLHADLFYREILEQGFVDVVCHGEGEETVLDLARWAVGEKCPAEIRGISYRNGSIVKNEQRDPVQNLDELPFPVWRNLPYHQYGLLPFATIAKPALTLSGSRGCPYKCRFCSLKYLGRRLRIRSHDSILDEIRHLKNEYQVRQVAFVDAYFPISEKQGLEFCEAVGRSRITPMPVLLSQMRVDVVTSRLMQHLKKAGMRRVMFGIESGVQELLDVVEKKFTVAQAADAVRIARQAKIETVGFFIFGLPGDRPEYIRKTIRFSKSIPLDFAKYSMFVPFPGSDIYDSLVADRILKKNDWKRFTTFNPRPGELPYVTPGLTPEQLTESQHKANLAFYLRAGVVFNLLFRVRTIPFRMLYAGIGALFKSGISSLFHKAFP